MMMKKILFILCFLPVALFSQITDSTYLYDLPYENEWWQDFEDNITGVVAFNGGRVTNVDGKLIIDNGASPAASRGAQINFTHEASTEYKVTIEVLDLHNTGGMRVLSQWSTMIDTIKTTGWHTIRYTSDATAGGFGNKLVMTPLNTVLDSVTIGFLQISKYLPNRDVFHKGETIDSINMLLREVGTIYGNDFENDISGVTVSGIAAPTAPYKGAFVADVTTTGQIVCFGSNLFNDTSSFQVYIDITIDMPVELHSVWSSAKSSPIVTISESGRYNFNMSRAGVQANSALDGVCIRTAGDAGRIQVNDIIIRPVNYNAAEHQAWIEFGANASVTRISNPITQDDNDAGVAIGFEATVVGEGIAIGDSAVAALDGTYGTVGGKDMTAIGHKSKSYGWRNTAIGGHTHAAGQSSTAIGTGAVALNSHSIALGRGSYAGDYGNSETSNALVTDAKNIWFSNGWGHYFDTPISGIDIGNDATPSDVEIKIFAQDAYDARAVPSSYNIAAGHLGFYAGRGTGTGEGGELRFYTAPQAGVGQNVKNDAVMSAKFDSDATVSTGTDLWLLDRSDDTMKRVQVKEPTGSGQNKVIGFRRLYIE